MRLSPGFTLIEMLLTVAVLGMITLISIPHYQTYHAQSDLQITIHSIADSFRRAQLRAASADQRSAWGVRVSSSSVVLFKGSSYTGRDASFDEIIFFPAVITLTGATDTIMSAPYGFPTPTSTFTITMSNGFSKTITLARTGAVDY